MFARIVLFAVALIACERQSQPVIVSGGDARVQRVGRFDTRRPAAPRFAWPASEVELAFDGASLHITLTDTPHPDDTPETDWLAVQVDAAPVRALPLQAGKHEYALARALLPGKHRVRILKRTEPEVGTITLHGFRLAPGGQLLTPRARPSRRIEVVGDSISAGYGIEGPDAQCHADPRMEDATRTYATHAAHALGADVTVTAWSGKGVVRNYEERDRETMPELFERILPGDPASPLVHGAAPDAFVVHLGTNDFFRGIPDEQAFISRYESVLERLHARAPKAPMVLVLTPMLADDYPQPNARTILRGYLAKVIERERAKGHTPVLLEQYTDPAEGVGCDFHPNLKTHARLGRELADALRPLLGATGGAAKSANAIY
jgi:lysophospholipase L1-like esterase